MQSLTSDIHFNNFSFLSHASALRCSSSYSVVMPQGQACSVGLHYDSSHQCAFVLLGEPRVTLVIKSRKLCFVQLICTLGNWEHFWAVRKNKKLVDYYKASIYSHQLGMLDYSEQHNGLHANLLLPFCFGSSNWPASRGVSRGRSGHKVLIWISVLLQSVQLITGLISVSYPIVYPHYGACTMQYSYLDMWNVYY